MVSAKRTWNLSVITACLRQADSKDFRFTKKDLDKIQLPRIVEETRSIGKTPHQTLARVLQGLRDIRLLKFVDNKGMYELVPQQLLLNALRQKEKMSSGERMVSRILDELNIEYQREKSFLDLKSPKGGFLRFDFYFEINGRGFAIEFDGEQHRRPIECFGGEAGFIELKLRDIIKDVYTKNNDIILIRLNKLDHTEAKKLIINVIKENK